MKKTTPSNCRVLRLLAAALLLLAVSVSANAYDFSAVNDDGVTIYYNIVSSSESTCEVTYYSSSSNNAYSGTVVIPSSVNHSNTTYIVAQIDESTFAYCSGLTEITIPNSVTTIGSSAFNGCERLTCVTIGESVTVIGGEAFRGCTGLTDIYSLNPEPPTCGSSVFYNVGTSTCTLYVPIGSKDAYSTADQWQDFLNIVEMDMTPVSSITAGSNAEAVGYYTTDGKKMSHLQRGINIVRYSDGTAKKVMVK